MKYQLTKKLGSAEISFSGDSESHMDFIKNASFFYDLSEMCPNCKSMDVRVHYRAPKGYEYASIVCNECHWELKFGQYKDSTGLFAKGWEKPFSNQQENPGIPF